MTSIDLTDPLRSRLGGIPQIPENVRNVILPPSRLSITSLCKYSNLPGPHVMSHELRAIKYWFSPHPPSATFKPSDLPSMPVPPKDLVEYLLLALRSQPAGSVKSITAAHVPIEHEDLPHQLPLWVVQYWHDVYTARVSRQDWQASLS